VKRWCIAAVTAWLTWPALATAADLSDTEQRWLRGAWPVVTWAKAEGLPLDIVVQPQAAPDAAPLAMAFIDGRCKLVLSMRGNDEAQSTLERTPADLRDAAIELMTAHEIGHCRRHLDGAWLGTPAGFVAREPQGLPQTLRSAWAQMQATRREEAYADLVGLAWVRRHHAQDYARLHAWLLAERSRDHVPGDHHDTLAWIAPAADERFDGATIFAAAQALWPQGLAAER
jgi:hypothetical protein